MGKIIEMKQMNTFGPCWYNARSSCGFARNAFGEMSHYFLERRLFKYYS